ncbi:FAD-dependent monooxygenase [Nocardia rhamnosiphila]|uniref:FAD-dependent monooxygenase n=1 Tax=Nocardia rhamnosiphila TaxID=426716 RepID=UPI0033EB8FA5
MSFSRVSRTSVLIVGAGPTGLVLGIELLRRGVECRVVDRLTAPVRTSRSFTVHTRTLELLELAGIVEEFQERGLRGEWMDYRFAGGKEKVRLDFTGLDSRYPYYRTISQHDAEDISGRRSSTQRPRSCPERKQPTHDGPRGRRHPDREPPDTRDTAPAPGTTLTATILVRPGRTRARSRYRT